MTNKSLSELIEYLDETEKVLAESTCFCSYDAKEAMAVAWEAIRRLQKIVSEATGEDGLDS